MTGISRRDAREVLRAVRRDREDGHRLQPGRQPVVVRHRQGQRHHQLPSGDRAHRQARHGPVLGDRPAQRHGRPRGRRPRQHARRAHGHRGRRRIAIACSASGTRRPSPRSPASRPSTCSAPSPTGASRRCGSWRPTRSSPCRRPSSVEAAIRACPFVVVSDVTARHRHGAPRPCAAAGRGVGREGRHRHQFGAAHLAPAQLSAAARRGAPRLVDHLRGRQAHGASATPSPMRSPAEIFAEHAALSRFENDGTRDFDIGALADDRRRRLRGAAAVPVAARSADGAAAPRMFADGRFFTPDGKARFVAVRATPIEPRTSPAFPLTLNTGRVRDHWHTMTRTGKSQRLSQHCAEPFVEIHPQDAARHHIGDADLVRVSTGLGAILVRALLSPRQQPGSIFVPMHWNDQFASRARVDVLVAGRHRSDLRPAGLEERSGAHRALRRRHLRLRRAAPQAGGTSTPSTGRIAKCSGGWRVELAFAATHSDWPAFVAALVGGDAPEIGRLSRRCRPAAIASPATRTTVSPARSSSRPSRSPCRATGRSRSSARRRPCAPHALLGHRRPSGQRRRRSRRHRLLLLRRRRQRDRRRRGARLHDGRGDRRSAAGRHQLRLLPRRNPQHHRRATRHRGRQSPSRARVSRRSEGS